MQKEPFSQLELFSQDDRAPAAQCVRRPLSSYLIAYEKVVVIAIGFTVTAVVAFCFGVEKGKAATSAKNNVSFDLADSGTARTVVRPAASVRKPAPAPVATSPVSFVPVKQIEPGEQLIAQNPFTIQVASYQAPDLARKEADRLNKQGFKAVLVTKGSYQVLCVGNFSNKESAKSLLSQLKNKYRDCYIRRL